MPFYTKPISRLVQELIREFLFSNSKFDAARLGRQLWSYMGWHSEQRSGSGANTYVGEGVVAVGTASRLHYIFRSGLPSNWFGT